MYAAARYVVALALAGGCLSSADAALMVERMELHQFEDGPVLPSSYEYVPGETANFTCRLSGYQVEKSGPGDTQDQRLVKLSWRLEVFDPAGLPIEKPQEGRIEDKLSPQDKEWLGKVLTSFVVPPFAIPGNYRISIQAKDEIARSETHGELTFRVRGHEVEPSETLTARNFRFLSSEDDNIGTRSGLYRPGEVLWAHFDITGYKFQAGNRFSVECGMAVETPDGQRLFTQPEAASQNGDGFYPQRYVPITLNLSLDKAVKPAMYTLVIMLRDKIGDQSIELREPFVVQ